MFKAHKDKRRFNILNDALRPASQLHLYTMMNKVGLAESIRCDGTIDLLYASQTKYFELKYFYWLIYLDSRNLVVPLND